MEMYIDVIEKKRNFWTAYVRKCKFDHILTERQTIPNKPVWYLLE